METIKCEACGKEIKLKDIYTTTKGLVCKNCYKNIKDFNFNLVTCYKCGNLVNKDDVMFEEGQYVCIDCYDGL